MLNIKTQQGHEIYQFEELVNKAGVDYLILKRLDTEERFQLTLYEFSRNYKNLINDVEGDEFTFKDYYDINISNHSIIIK